MATCNCCGAELTPKEKFCWQCGTKVEQKLYCTNCGAELTPKDKFCWQCGTPAPAPAAPARVRPASFQAAPAAQTVGNLEDTYPNVKGFYEEGAYKDTVSVSDRAVVWADADQHRLFRLGKEKNTLLKRSCGWVVSTVQTPYGILTAERGGTLNTCTFTVKEYDDDLHLISTQKWEVPQRYSAGYDYKVGAALSEHYLFIAYKPSKNDKYVFTRISLDDGRAVEVSECSVCIIDGASIESVDRLLTDSGMLYILGVVSGVYGESDITPYKFIAAIDFDTDAVKHIWMTPRFEPFSGQPHFFNFAQKIMWTELTRYEVDKYPENLHRRLLFPRHIGPDEHSLCGAQPLIRTPNGGMYFNYFDGENYLTAGDYTNFLAHPNMGRDTITWSRDGGYYQETIVWPEQRIAIADLSGDHKHTVYPLNYDPDNGIGDQGILLEVEVTDSEDK